MAIRIREEWREIEEHEGHYISNFGRLKNDRMMRKFSDDKDGYQVTQIEGKHCKAHRLVGFYFIPNNDPINKIEINHKDGCKWNNREDNLEWVTPSRNKYHAYETGLKQPQQGSQHGASKLTEQIVLAIRKIWKEGKLMQKEIAVMFNVAATTISMIVNRITWRHI